MSAHKVKATPAARLLRPLLGKLERYLALTGLVLFVDDPAAAPAAATPAPPPAATPSPPAQPPAPTPAPTAAPAPAGAPAPTPAPTAAPAAAAPAGAPEAYADFTLPDGVTLDAPLLGEFKTIAKELNLPQEAAQKLVGMGARIQQGNAQALQTAVEAQGVEWGKAAQADREIGGDKFKENLAVADKALDRFGTPELRSLLDASKLGQHPEVLRAFYRIGKAISEDGFVPGRSGAGQKSDAEVFYPASQTT